MDYITACKIIFHFGAVTTKEQIAELISKHTDNFSIATFYPERQIGANKITFAVVNVPQSIVPKLMKEEAFVKDIDLMASMGGINAKGCEMCGASGGCGS